MSERETWSTRAGFILAAVGSAVGLGNIWQFPFQAASNGGAAFVVVYLAAVLCIGFPAMLAEFVVGRSTERNPIDAFRELGGNSWSVVGALGVFAAFWILSFYSVVGGWVIRYILGSAQGAYFADPGGYFGAISSGPGALALHAVFMALVVGVVALGVEDGIEMGTKLMVPAIVVLLLGLGAWVATLDGAAAGYAYYLSPDLNTLADNIGSVLPAAVGQAFFTLSLGMGAMVTYASYLGDDDSLPVDGGLIVGLNTLVGLLAGLVVIPILATQVSVEAIRETSGAGAVFISLAEAFGQLPAGRVLGVVFFGVLLLAALSSAISLLEVVVSFVTRNTGWDRKPAAGVFGLAVFLLGIPTAFSASLTYAGTGALTWYNDLAYNLLLPISVLGVLVFVGWLRDDHATEELTKGTALGRDTAGTWIWAMRTVVIVAVVVTLFLGVQDLLVAAKVLADPVVAV
ncbi:sodium-dependent transporter [Haloarchaeobius amylolyticus]|uniref:sodium-dependent transporter n=1 Tax=Haloarchaeobius amylolyticus TaxID=1198296 RepID=UPI002271A9C4|nr:sodium-dependent transporter [Haloarchaeobius amylolyticus]